MNYNWAKWWEGYHAAFEITFSKDGDEVGGIACYPKRSIPDVRWLLAEVWRPGAQLLAECASTGDEEHYLIEDQEPTPFSALEASDRKLAIRQWKKKLKKATPKKLRAAIAKNDLKEAARAKAEEYHYVVGFARHMYVTNENGERFLVPLGAKHMREDGRSLYDVEIEEEARWR